MTPDLYKMLVSWLTDGDEHQRRHAEYRLSLPDAVEFADALALKSKASEAPAPYPSWLTMAGNVASAAGRAISGAVQGERVARSVEEQGRCLVICQSCDQWDLARGRCRVCGCIGRWKTRLATEHCPLDPPKW